MSVKSAMYERFKNREGVKIVKVPKSMRPTQKSLEELGKKIAWGIEQNSTPSRMIEEYWEKYKWNTKKREN